MERTKTYKPKPGEKKWRKIGGGSIHLPNKIIKPGEILWLDIEKIPEAFRDLFELVEEPMKKEFKKIEEEVKDIVDRKAKEKEIVKNEDVTYKIVKNEESSTSSAILYNIVDSNGNVLNKRALTQEEANTTLAEILNKKKLNNS